MDRGVASLEYLKAMGLQKGDKKKYYVVRLNMNYKLEYGAGNLVKVGTGKHAGWYRVINFCDICKRSEYRLVTNLRERTAVAEPGITDLEVIRQRW